MTVVHPTLYKRTSTGAIQTWWMEQDGNMTRVHTGQIDGKITTSPYKPSYGKNIGKKNETSDEQQALLEIEAEYKKKKAQGRYHDSPETIDIAAFHVPMTAKKYRDRWEGKEDKQWATDEEYFSQPKLDGIRCIIKHDGMWTRRGKPIVAVPHVWEATKAIFETHPDIILDGELYNHELRRHLNRISGICRKKKPTPEELEEAKIVQFHMYDVTGDAVFEIPMVDDGTTFDFVVDSETVWYDAESSLDRMTALALVEMFFEGHDTGDVIQFVETIKLENQEQLDTLSKGYIEDGYEGQMIRFASGVYEHKYSAELLKRKNFFDAEFRIVAMEEGSGTTAGQAGNIICVTPDGIEFGTGVAFSHEEARQIWEEREAIIAEGSEATVRYMEANEYGKPLVGKTHVIHRGGREL